jgi:DNA-binding beta-propeller fold protein YncE
VLSLCSAPFFASSPKLTGGTGTIYVGSYAKRMVVIDEATERVTAEIPLATGIPWSARRSQDGTRFYIQNADQEHFEIVDLAARKSIDAFMLSEGNRRVRALAFAVDPQHRIMTLVTRTTTKLVDRFEIGAPTFIQYDLSNHRVIRTLPWSTDPEPAYFSLMRYSPDGKLLYVFSEQILVLDATSLQQLDTWDLALPNEPSLGRFDLGSLDDTNDDPDWFSALFTMKDPVQHRALLVVGRVNLDQRSVDFFPLGPATDQGGLSFALSGDRQHAYALLQQIGHHELWTIDLANKRRQSKVEFNGRPRMAIRTSSNGKIIYLHQAGNTIALYEADGFKYLRTITLEGDMPYDTVHVVPPRPPQ